MAKSNILIFPCGSEIALEIHRSMKYSAHYHLIGGSSVDDHGRFIFDDYIGNIPFHHDPQFISVLSDIVKKNHIEAIYPAMDAVAVSIKKNENKLGCRVIGSSLETTIICSSKQTTYNTLENHFPVPEWHMSLDKVKSYPVFIKPDEGYGSRNVFLAKDNKSAADFISTKDLSCEFVFCEYLPGNEYTIDCFSNRHGKLLFSGGRERARISNGISTNTKIVAHFNDIFHDFAEKINAILRLRGAWFFQMKLDKNEEPKLLEIAARLGGSSSLFRSQGINFALLSTFDAFNIDVSILKNDYNTELDRALSNKYALNIDYDTVYIDYDDCLLINSTINTELIAFIFSCINKDKKVLLITRHEGNIYQSLEQFRISNLFDKIIHLTDKKEPKSKYINPIGAIFIDDSYAERADVHEKHKIPVFSPDMIETLI